MYVVYFVSNHGLSVYSHSKVNRKNNYSRLWKNLYLPVIIYRPMRSSYMERQNIVDDVILWLSLLSIAAICLVMFYYGVAGLAHVPVTDFSITKKAFGVSVFVLFILLPLLILSLVLDTTFISKLFEWSLPLLYIAIVVDIITMTALYLLM